MAAKTDHFRISSKSANIWVKNICGTPRHMLLDTTNTFLIHLDCSHNSSQYGSQKLENFQKMHDINL